MPSAVAGFETGHRWITPVTFVRLLIPQLLPAHVEKALYLDCDMVVRDDLSELWDIPVGERALLAARDTIGTVSNQAGLSNYQELGIPADAKYFNAGVLVMNLKKWRTCGTSERLLSYMRKHSAIIKHADQEVLNAVLFDDWGELDYRWNWQITWRGVRIGTHEREWSPNTTRKSIVHFITGEKPWLPGCDYEEKKYFFEYLDRTEWAGWRVPWMREVYGRSIRSISDARNAAGRLRQRLGPRVAPTRTA
jgi:lipopolysaccharide biosynthesis glycosyltransferase